MICNIIDRRKRPYRWKSVNAVVEPAWQDNSVDDADQAKPADIGFPYAERSNVSLADAIAWAASISYPVTLYVYDQGEGI